MRATYTKLKDGTWAVRVTGGTPDVGQAIVVNKASGSTGNETIAKILWTGPDKKTGETVVLCTVTPRAARNGYSGRSSRVECNECGDWVDRGTACWETGLIH